MRRPHVHRGTRQRGCVADRDAWPGSCANSWRPDDSGEHDPDMQERAAIIRDGLLICSLRAFGFWPLTGHECDRSQPSPLYSITSSVCVRKVAGNVSFVPMSDINRWRALPTSRPDCYLLA
jgi:hypothetical protein